MEPIKMKKLLEALREHIEELGAGDQYTEEAFQELIEMAEELEGGDENERTVG
jgi:chorismate mutase